MSIEYTHDRFVALLLVSGGRITAVNSILRRTDGGELDASVFAALVALEARGCIERPAARGSEPFKPRPVRLTEAGIRLLTRFRRETRLAATSVATTQAR